MRQQYPVTRSHESAVNIEKHVAKSGRQAASRSTCMVAGSQGEKQSQIPHLGPEAICLQRKDNITELLSPLSLQG